MQPLHIGCVTLTREEFPYATDGDYHRNSQLVNVQRRGCRILSLNRTPVSILCLPKTQESVLAQFRLSPSASTSPLLGLQVHATESRLQNIFTHCILYTIQLKLTVPSDLLRAMWLVDSMAGNSNPELSPFPIVCSFKKECTLKN